MSRLVEKVDSKTFSSRPDKGREGRLKAWDPEDSVFRARQKFERWAQSISGLYDYQYVPLVAPPDDSGDGVLEADEFSLVPTRDLENYRHSFVEAREMLDHMEEQLDAALAAREAEGE